MPDDKTTSIASSVSSFMLVVALCVGIGLGGATCYAVARWANAKADEAEVRVEIMRREGLLPVERRR